MNALNHQLAGAGLQKLEFTFPKSSVETTPPTPGRKHFALDGKSILLMTPNGSTIYVTEGKFDKQDTFLSQTLFEEFLENCGNDQLAAHTVQESSTRGISCEFHLKTDQDDGKKNLHMTVYLNTDAYSPDDESTKCIPLSFGALHPSQPPFTIVILIHPRDGLYWSGKPTEFALALDVGNTRTCGYLVSVKELNKAGAPLGRELEYFSLKGPELRESVFHSHFCLKSADQYGEAEITDKSLARLGTVSEKLVGLLSPEDQNRRIGMSSPKRYLWDDTRNESDHWQMIKDSEEPYVTLGLSGDILGQLPIEPLSVEEREGEVETASLEPQSEIVAADVENSGPRVRFKGIFGQKSDEQINPPPPPTTKPTAPAHRLTISRDGRESPRPNGCDLPNSRMMILILYELFAHAHRMLNSEENRRFFAGGIRIFKLDEIVLTYPSNMSIEEKFRYQRMAEIARDMLVANAHHGLYAEGKPTISLPIDEGAAGQMVLVRDLSTALDTSPSRGRQIRRLATLDVGGGTSDLYMADYTFASEEIFHKEFLVDGLSIGGDHLVKAVMERIIIPAIIANIFPEMDDQDADAKIRTDWFWAGQAEDRKIRSRISFVRKFLLNITYTYLDIASTDSYETWGEAPNRSSIESIERRNRNISFSGTQEDCTDFQIAKNVNAVDLKNAAEYIGIDETRLRNVLIKYSRKQFEAVTLSVFGNGFKRLSSMAGGADFLMLAGRTSTLPTVRNLLIRYWPDARGKIIAPNQLPTPLRFSQLSKYVVCYGAALERLSQADELSQDGETAFKPLRYENFGDSIRRRFNWSVIDKNKSKSTWMRFEDPENLVFCHDTEDVTSNIPFNGRKLVIGRSAHIPGMALEGLVNCMYEISYIKTVENAGYRVDPGAYVTVERVKIDREEDREEGLRLENVQGTVSKGEISMPLTLADVSFRLKTTFFDVHFLDSGMLFDEIETAYALRVEDRDFQQR